MDDERGGGVTPPDGTRTPDGGVWRGGYVWYQFEPKEPNIDELMARFNAQYAMTTYLNHPWLWRLRCIRERLYDIEAAFWRWRMRGRGE